MTRRLRDIRPGLVAVLALVAFACRASAEPLDRAEAVARALARSPEVAADRAATREASRLVDAAGAYPHNPRLAVETSGDGFGPIGAENLTFRLGLSQEFDVHGTRGARRDVATAEAAILDAETVGRLHALGRRTEEAFGVLLVERRRVALSDSMARASARVVEAARRAARQETISPYALRQLELDDARLREATARARAGQTAAEGTLRALMLADPAESIEPVDDLDDATWRLPADSLSDVALTVRHDVLEARAREALRGAEVLLSSREGRPGPEVELFVEHDRDQLEEAPEPVVDDHAGEGRHSVTRVGAGLQVPLLFFQPQTWPGERNAIAEARARAARVTLEARIPIEVRAACDRVAAAQERAALLKDALARVDEDRRLLEAAYREGRVDLDTYLAQRNRLVEAAAAGLDARAALEEARSALAQATGLTHVALATALGGPR
jgi:outer membrane protein TolC